jgi:hypothetical protein
MTDESKAKKIYKRADYSVFAETCAAIGKKETEVCESLGYSPNSWTEWKKTNQMPRVAAIACEGIRRRMGLSEKTFLVKVATKEQENALTAICKGLGLEFVNI